MKILIKNLARLILCLAALAAAPLVHALPLALDPPSPNLDALDYDGTLLVVDDLREADFGGGLRLPVRWVYHSSDQSSDNPYGWAGFNLAVLECKAVKKTAGLYFVTMLNGEVEYFRTNSGDDYLDWHWRSNNNQWTGVEDGNKFTITRWDGWEIEFHDGRIYSLKTDDNRTLRWEYDSVNPALVTRVYEPSTNETTIQVGISASDLHMCGSSTLRGAHTLTVNGDTYTFSYFGGTLQDIVFPDGRKTQWKFESLGQSDKRLTLTQESGWWRSWVFDAQSRMVKTDDYWNYTVGGDPVPADDVVYEKASVERTRVATGETEKWTFSALSSIKTTKDVLGNESISYTYQTVGKLYNRVFKRERKKAGESTASVIWRGVYDSATGDLLSSFDALDKQTTYSYERFAGGNEFLPPKKVTITDPMERVSTIERDQQGNIIEVVDAAGVKRKLEYDSRDRLTHVRNAANEVLMRFVYGDKDQILERYDAQGNKTAFDYTVHLGEPLLTKVTTPEGRITEWPRDTMGRVSKLKTSSGAEWNFAYVGDWSVTETITDPLNAETSFEYDARLNEIKITDPLNRITQTVYDDLDLPKEVTDALNQKTKFENNGNRDMKKLTDARNNAYNLAWEKSGVRKSLQWPDADKQTNIFDLNGNLSQWKAKGDAGVVIFSRNDAGEVTGRTWTAGNESGSVSFSRNALGQISSATATTMGLAIAQGLSYNADGRLSGLSQIVAYSAERTAGLTYDLDGRVATITYPEGFVVAYVYNNDGQIKFIKKDGAAIASYAYDTAGRLSTRTLSNGVVTTYTYNAANRLASITVSNGATVLWAERYGYNAAGERIYTLQGVSGTVGDAYGLDATSQLRGVKYGSTDATLPYADQSGQTAFLWQYDAVGNRVAETGSGGNTTYSSGNTNQYTSVSSVSSLAYSDRGDLAQFGDWTYTYDARGNLIRANNTQTSVSSQYWRDAFGQRAAKDVNGSKTLFFNVGTTQLEARDATSGATTSTIYEPGIDRPLAEVSSSGALAFYHQDFLGSVVLLTDASGAKLQSFTYDVWGKPSGFDASGTSIPISSFASQYLYTARSYDAESGLYHYRTRACSTVLGRFLQADSIDFDGGDVNLFRYVGNNPATWLDPTGLQSSLNSPAGASALASLVDAGALSAEEALQLAGAGALASEIAKGESECVAPKPPFQGEPGSTASGEKQTRKYGSDGYPETDVDSGHDHGAGDPHAHDWGRPEDGGKPTHEDRGPGRPLNPNDPAPPDSSR
ncbi:MAG: hypothetical protein NTV93_19565 [Verrucomicrobia bacterium]|nr:hypothetical protein [Verrucomicrobiota bacterium]